MSFERLENFDNEDNVGEHEDHNADEEEIRIDEASGADDENTEEEQAEEVSSRN